MKKVTIFSDGACSGNPGPGGWAAIIKINDEINEISGNCEQTTNNRMELTAVIKALESLNEPCVVEIFTDSKYVVNSINLGWAANWKKNGWVKKNRKPALNSDLFEKLLNLNSNHSIKYFWVQGHSGDEFNERCDKLAVSEYLKLL